MTHYTENLLIVFIKNPIAGQVKTRLARSIGNDQALKVYKLLLSHTFTIASQIKADKAIYYSEFIPNNDIWKSAGFKQNIQVGEDLGIRMRNSFKKGFENNYKSTVIVGSDCYELKSEIIEEAFDVLHHKDVVIGPANDGGYYLLGMKQLHEEIFFNKSWGTEHVLNETINDLEILNLSHERLDSLNDIDTELDLLSSPLFIQSKIL